MPQSPFDDSKLDQPAALVPQSPFDDSKSDQPAASLPGDEAPRPKLLKGPTGEHEILMPCTFNGEPVRAVIDSGVTKSLIDPGLVARLGFRGDYCCGKYPFANRTTTPRLAHGSVTLVLADRPVGGTTFDVSLEVMDLDSDAVIGLDLFPRLGLEVRGVPTTFPETAVEELEAITSGYDMHHVDNLAQGVNAYTRELKRSAERLPDDQYKELMDALRQELEANEGLSPHELCTHPAAVVSLNTGDAEPVFRDQYKVAHALWPVVDAKVQEWLKDGVPYQVATDASQYGVGAVLYQEYGNWVHAEGHFHSLFLFKSLLSARHFWPGMRKDGEQLVRA